jgi:hypothetical protein
MEGKGQHQGLVCEEQQEPEQHTTHHHPFGHQHADHNILSTSIAIQLALLEYTLLCKSSSLHRFFFVLVGSHSVGKWSKCFISRYALAAHA